MRRLIGTAAVLVLLQSGCGGSGSSTSTSGTTGASTAPKTAAQVKDCVSAAGFTIDKVVTMPSQFGRDVAVTTAVPEDTAPVHFEVFQSAAAASKALPGAAGVGSSAGYNTRLIANVLVEIPADAVTSNVQKLNSCA